jgi:hypothetical protein
MVSKTSFSYNMKNTYIKFWSKVSLKKTNDNIAAINDIYFGSGFEPVLQQQALPNQIKLNYSEHAELG